MATTRARLTTARDDSAAGFDWEGITVDGLGTPRDAAEPEPTVEVLADLQAGLLDDATAARVRRQVRDDPAAAGRLAALDRVRHDLRALGTDVDSAPPVPDAVTARLRAALTTSPRPRTRRAVAVVGAVAAVVAVGVGGTALLRGEVPPPAPSSALGPADFPLTEAQLRDVLNRSPDYGSLSDPRRRASCLAGLGYPAATSVLGATTLSRRGETVQILLLPGGTPATVRAVAVRVDCSSADSGFLRETTLARP